MPKLETKEEIKFEDLSAESKALVAPVMKKLDFLRGELDKKANSADVVDKASIDKAIKDVEASKAAVNEAIAEAKKLGETMNAEFAKLQRSGGGGAASDVKKKIADLRGIELDAFDHYFRTGETGELRAAQVKGAELSKELDVKDLSTVIFQDGGVMVHPEHEAEMIEILNETSPMREIAQVREIGGGKLKVPVNKKGAVAAWTTELAARTRTLTSEIEEIEFGADEIYALPLATLSILEDAEFDVEQWLNDEAVEAMELAENTAFVVGDGIKKPRGFTTADKVANASWSWGKHGYVVTGASGAFAPSYPGDAVGPTAATNGFDALISLIYAFKRAYRNNLDWVGNRATLETIRKLKDGQGNYLVRDAITESGFLTMVLGYPYQEFEDMPDIGADTYALALGDFYRGYLIVDRVGLQVRRDEITSPGNVIFHFRRRTGGDCRDYQAIKFLKFGTS